MQKNQTPSAFVQATAATAPAPQQARLVLFLTHETPADVPATQSRLACLLPLGSATFVERLMDSCALAGVRQIDLVVSDDPETLRRILMDGTPWGIALRWHHVKESSSPYKALRGMQLEAEQHTVIGHAHQWINSRVLGELMQTEAVALQLEPEVCWTGWFSANAASVSSLGPHADYAAVATRLRRMERARCVMAAPAECARADSAIHLLNAQRAALQGQQEAAIPATWLRTRWGAQSPDAQVHAQARIEGPVLIGPGCVVEAGAELGPEVVLSRDVFVARGARVAESLVMANTYVGGQVTLEKAIAQGHSIQSLKWQVRSVLAPSDALLTPLRPEASRRTPWLSRLAALLVAALLLPLLLPALLAQWLLTRRVLWLRTPVVRARLQTVSELAWTHLRLPHGAHRLHRGVGYFGALLDIVQGRRNWFGIRARSESEWHALGSDWQTLFSASPIGLFHAPAWRESSGSLNHEAEAAADAFMAVHNRLTQRFKLMCQCALGRR